MSKLNITNLRVYMDKYILVFMDFVRLIMFHFNYINIPWFIGYETRVLHIKLSVRMSFDYNYAKNIIYVNCLYYWRIREKSPGWPFIKTFHIRNNYFYRQLY